MARVLPRVRASRDTDASTSEEQQRALLQRWADDNGHEIVTWAATDLNVSGEKDPFKTPGLGPYLTEPLCQEWDILAALNMSRLCRKQDWYIDVYRWCRDNGKQLVLTETDIDMTDPLGRSIAYLYAGVAEDQLNTIRKRNQGSQEELRRLGRWHGGTPPFGYQAEKLSEGGYKLAPNWDEARILRELFDRAADRESVRSLAADLNTRGVPTRRGGAWTAQTVTRMLRARWPLGQAEHNGQVVTGDDGMPVRRAVAVIDFSVWQSVQGVLDDRKRPKKRKNPPAPLLNVAFCGECGEPLYHTVMTKPERGQSYRYWRCSGRTKKRNGCTSAGIPAGQLEAFVSEQFIDEIGELERTKMVYVPAEGHADEISQIDDSIGRIRKEADAGLYKDSDDEYISRLLVLTSRRKELAAKPNRPARWDYVGTGETWAEAWASALDETARRELLLNAGVRVTAGLKHRTVPDFNIYIDLDRLEVAAPGYSAAERAAELDHMPPLPTS